MEINFNVKINTDLSELGIDKSDEKSYLKDSIGNCLIEMNSKMLEIHERWKNDQNPSDTKTDVIVAKQIQDSFKKYCNNEYLKKTSIKFDLIYFKHNINVDTNSIYIYGYCFNWKKFNDFILNTNNFSEIYPELTGDGCYKVEMEIYLDSDDDSSWIAFDNYKIEKYV